MEKPLPTIFVSHGAPTLPLEDVPARKFLKKLGKQFKNVKSVLCVSAHWSTSIPTVNAVEHPPTIHDFYGFPDELYEIEYPATGDPELAEKISDHINAAGIKCDLTKNWGLDHGAWVPLMLMYPNADIPVVQLSIQKNLDPEKHLKIGNALTELNKENVLIMGSGGAVHPLGYQGARFSGEPQEWALKFDKWLTDAIANGNKYLLTNYRQLAPYPERAHPYPDHYMPLLSVLGAAGESAKGEVIHHSWAGDMGMAAYKFSGF